MDIADFDYSFPRELIAHEPAEPRDAARLLVYNRTLDSVRNDIFHNLVSYIPPRSVLVFNESKVIPARFMVRRRSGGTVALLFLNQSGTNISVLSKRTLKQGETLMGEGYRLTVAEKLSDASYQVDYAGTMPFLDMLHKYGTMPLPPYIKAKNPHDSRWARDYQSVFAKYEGSVAAPTASLHFTSELLAAITRAGHEIAYVTLHVGRGTFAPLTNQHIEEKQLHSEYYAIDEETARSLNTWKAQRRRIIAVGTTTVRTLESACERVGILSRLQGDTRLFIDEAYGLKFVDSLITNFHVPGSSLLMLVSAFIDRRKMLELYQAAIAEKFRLFSFGDGMFIV